ncbi:MAG: hypothetical protein Q9160_005870 [Pyrenula sp. 1 TL-2023]
MYGEGHRQTNNPDISVRPQTPPSTSSPAPSESHTPPQSTSQNPQNRPVQTSTTAPSSRPDTGDNPTAKAQLPAIETQHQHKHSVGQQGQGFDQAGFPLTSNPGGLASSPSSPRLQPTYRSTRSLGGSEATSPSRIKVRDLSHIQSFASEEFLAAPKVDSRGSSRSFQDVGRQYEISAMPVTDIIEMVAGLLTKITTTNDQQHEHLHHRVSPPEDTTSLGKYTQSVLAFHGKNVPSITILSYLSRIHKYCPTTYEVFLSLLVYFDRMTERVNRPFLEKMQQQSESTGHAIGLESRRDAPSPMMVDESGVDRSQPSIVSPPSSDRLRPTDQPEKTPVDPPSPTTALDDDATNLAQFFVVDSYNIHRLVIAGVTCASKFFSDVFYTNSRYAKVRNTYTCERFMLTHFQVGGLPLNELNHLEVQFLDLNDFRLAIPVEELDAYGTMLVEFYAREVVAQQQHMHQQHAQRLARTHDWNDGVYMRSSGERSSKSQQTPTPP